MTERERRAKGLPPSPAQVALADSIQALAERQVASLAPVMAEVTRLGSVAAEAMRPAMEAIKHIEAERQMVIPAPTYGPRPVRLERAQFDELLDKLTARSVTQASSKELVYDWKTREFSRIVLGQKIRSSFSDQKDENKRRRLVEKLLRTQDYVRTKTLADLFGCSAKEISNMVAAVNKRFGIELTLQDRLIDSKPGKGYRINHAYVVYQKK